jgi:hypothetical protein
VTNDPTAVTPEWTTRFSRLLGTTYAAATNKLAVSQSTRGGHFYIGDSASGSGGSAGSSETTLVLSATQVSYGRAESGGGIFVDTQSQLYITDVLLQYNFATEAGGSLMVNDLAHAHLERSVVGHSGTFGFYFDGGTGGALTALWT